MDVVLQSLLDGIFRAGLIWSFLILFGLVPLVFLALSHRQPVDSSGAVLKEERLNHHVEELDVHADKLVANADQLAEVAAGRRKEWLALLNDAEVAWQAYNNGFAAAERLNAAAVLPTPRTPRTPSEYAERERFLRRAAMSACSRRQLSALDLSDALANRNGWDPRRHPVEQEVAISRVARDGFFAAYQEIAQLERVAWQAAEVAAVAARNSREEARLAMDEAWQVRSLLRRRPQHSNRHWGSVIVGRTALLEVGR